MINHKTFEIYDNDKKYHVLTYTEDDKNDYKFINKFISKHKFCKIIKNNSYYSIDDINTYHEYYNPGVAVSGVTYYENGKKITYYDN